MCEHASGRELVASNALAAAFADGFPLTLGHTLIVPHRHESDFLVLSSAEQAAVWALVPDVCKHIEAYLRPDGYNIGVNIGEAAGQTVGHAHLHVIPRYWGDVEDPRGGIRWIIPAKARYWKGA
jgi:diadenosine tetraphosphate (Ap4A) HIT family hydrolase